MLQKLFSTLVFLGVIAGAGYWFYNQQPCVQPITFRIGEVDSKFGLSRAQYLVDVTQAEEIWNKDIGKTLFKYDPKGTVVVNLVYDNRQATADKNAQVTTQINTASDSADAVRAQFLALKLEYKQNLDEYNQLLAQTKDFRAIEDKRQQVNALADEINSLIQKYNFLVSSVNTKINTINQTAGQEFEEGEYVYDASGERINIYEFKNQNQLVRVLAHEFGHAVGLDHNSNPNSIMYYLNAATNFTPSKDDTDSFLAVCRLKQ